jgi:hypothetical protein
MARTTTMTVCRSGALGGFVSANVGEEGCYENVGEYECGRSDPRRRT